MRTEARQTWRDVRDYIHGQILASKYRPGDKLPRDEDFAQELSCARTTVHRAMQSLVDDGVVERRRKGGTTVRSDPVTRTTLDIPITKVEIEARGHAYHHHLIDVCEDVPPPTVAARFGGADSGAALRIRALHLADGRPYVLEERWIALETVPEIRSVDLGTISANEWLVRNRPYNRCEVQIFADEISDHEVKYLEERPGSALLVLERTTWIDAAPITHVRAIHARGYRLLSNS